MRLKWVKGTACDVQKTGCDEQLVLESFELVPLPPASPEPEPAAELSIAAAALLASITASACPEHPRSPLSVVVTATVPLVHHVPGAYEREVAQPA